jgi:predicted aldo/keto reductase-like oxidoreductase
MLYRKLGNIDKKVSILGFGCMRLPVGKSKDSGTNIFERSKNIDQEESVKMIHYALEKGVNYFDTAYVYHGGNSETLLGKAIEGYREKILLSTKLPTFMVNKREEFDIILAEQLRRLRTSYLDVYLLHGLNRYCWPKVKEMGVLDHLDRLRREGIIRHVGFSFHDDVKYFKEIVDSYDWDLCQIQYNYLDEQYQAGTEGLEYAAAKGLGIVVMEPLRGGMLTGPIPGEVQTIWDSAEIRRSPAEWALRWVWNRPELSVALSGMTTMEHVTENVRLCDEGYPDSLNEKELSLIHRVKDTYSSMFKVHCTGCAYCMPCPNGVNIPLNFQFYNDLCMFHRSINKIMYNSIPPAQRASNCIECGICEDLCPQHIEIRKELKTVHGALSGEIPAEKTS